MACDRNNLIGEKGKLPWDIREDWDYFLKITQNGILIMGRHCYDEFEEHAKNRKALKAASIAIEHYPYAVELVVMKSQCYANLQEYGMALGLLEKAGNINPGDSEIFLIKGNVHALKGDTDDAFECFQRALENSDDKDEIYYSETVIRFGAEI